MTRTDELPNDVEALKRLILEDAAAENHARLWSLIASAERHSLDPQRYLTSVLAKIGTTPADEIAQFLPDVWMSEEAIEPITSA